jgi:hypothetical protein
MDVKRPHADQPVCFQDQAVHIADEDTIVIETPDIHSNVDESPIEDDDFPVIIFDWDDTLFPTSFLANLGLHIEGPDAPADIQAKLNILSECILLTINRAKQFGRVVIVTNAETGWVELTASKFFPLVASDIHQIPILSARSTFEPQGFIKPLEWKEQAFSFVLDSHMAQVDSFKGCMWSIGDSIHERDAVIRVCEAAGLPFKSVKLMDRPDLNVLYRQHMLVQKNMFDMTTNSDSLDVRVQLVSSASDESDTPFNL